jgi:16S rRNA pseudouridine516 synthase
MLLARLLYTQGFGTRRECAALVANGRVEVGDRVIDDPSAEVDVREDFAFRVEGVEWRYRERALLLLNKPAGVECSRAPRHHPSVLGLLPLPLRRRGVQPVGRLDADTTGVLLLTDDGALIHRLTSPRHHVPKVYQVGVKHPVTGPQLERLIGGVVLDDDPRPVRAAACAATGERALRLTLTEGKYHQVKRMLAAAGNRVESLHRSAFGPITLEAGPPPGQWRFVEADERAALLGRGA